MIVKSMTMYIAVISVLTSCTISKKPSKTSVQSETGQQVVVVKADTLRKEIKPYKEVITNMATTQSGLFKVHRVIDKYYFEVANSVLNKEILIVNRISRAAAEGFNTFGGDYIGENVVKFVKGPGDKLFIERSSYRDIPNDSSQNGMFRSILNSSFPTIIASFDIKAFSPDSSSLVIDVSDFLNGDNDVFFFHPEVKDAYKLGGIQNDKSYIQSVSSFPLNVEIKTVKTYIVEKRLLTYELNSSVIMLPATPMKPRYFDERVGYFAREYLNYEASRPVYVNRMVTRWRLEPKEEDITKYKNGELVEPQKPIVFYIDPATPKKWVPYLIKGVNDWQKAFEKAGFKNAIYAVEAPSTDSSWSLDDARHNAIVYKASNIQNASGPQVSDPRSGEILESHINWYHNIQQILHDWYFVQASPNDPEGRMMIFDDSLMGQLITYVCSHEVGHTLGLQHNFAASSAIPVDSLRSKAYLSINGLTPSIMDYARFNYVAQPQDSIKRKDLIPRIGVYDDWAIEWGYRWLPDLKTIEAEKNYLSRLIIDRQKKDKKLFFSNQALFDPRVQSEDIGDNAMKASYYGINNLKIVMSNLPQWAKTPNNNYDDMERLNNAILNQYGLLITHVLKYIGGEEQNPKTGDQNEPVYSFIPKDQQRTAMQFLQSELFTTPEWLFNKRVYSLSGSANLLTFQKFQNHILNLLCSDFVYNIILFAETNQSKQLTYSFNEMLTDLENGIFSELEHHDKVEFSRQILQNGHVQNLIHNIRYHTESEFGRLGFTTILNDHVGLLYRKITNSLSGFKDKTSKIHLSQLAIRLKLSMDIQKKSFMEFIPRPNKAGKRDNTGLNLPLNENELNMFLFNLNLQSKKCWIANDWMK